MAKKTETFVRRRYARLMGRNVYTWSVTIGGRPVVRSHAFRTEKALEANMRHVYALLGAALNRT